VAVGDVRGHGDVVAAHVRNQLVGLGDSMVFNEDLKERLVEARIGAETAGVDERLEVVDSSVD
jgi:hypothetical protein